MKKHFNNYSVFIGLFLFILLPIGLLLGCSIKSETIHGNIPVPSLTDEQLIQEMESIYISLGKKFNKAQFLMAMMPEPAYVLTSSYTRYNTTVFTMPLGYHIQGSGITTYQYTDANAGLEAIILIAQLVNQSKLRQLQDRGYAIVVEFRRRVEERRKNVEMEIEQFFIKNPDLRARRPLLSAILPWVASEKTFKSDTEMLEYAGDIARELRRSEKYLNTWFGTFSQVDHFRDGTSQAFSDFARMDLRVVGNVLVGKGITGTDQIVSLQAKIEDGKWRGVVTNETARGNFECEGVMTDTEFTVSYKGFAWGRHLEGTAVLLR